jgi:hypothetical protein
VEHARIRASLGDEAAAALLGHRHETLLQVLKVNVGEVDVVELHTGMAWIGTANSLTVAAQLALPDWVRARGMSICQMALMGGSAAGAALWGYVATLTSVQMSIITAAVLGPLMLLLTKHQGAGGSIDEDFTPAAPTGAAPPPVIDIEPNEGPVMVTIK